MMIIKKEINALRAEVEALVKLNNEMEAYRAVKAFAIEHDFRTISDMVFDTYWDEGLSELIKIERACIDEINKALDEIKREIHKAFTKEVKTALVDTFKVSSVEDFLLSSVVDAEADELAFDFGCLGYDGEFLNKELSEYEDIDDALEDINPFILSEDDIDDVLMTDLEVDNNFKFNADLFDNIYKEVKQQRAIKNEKIKKEVDHINKERNEIKFFVNALEKAGYEKFRYNTKNIEFNEEYELKGNKLVDLNRLNKLFNSILVVAENAEAVALLLKLNKDTSYRTIVIRKYDSHVKNSLCGGTFKQKIKTSGSAVRHQMDIQLEKKQGFEVGMLAAMAYEILDGVGRDTYKNTFVSHKFDQGNRDTSPVHNNCSRKGVEILVNDGINKYINDVHKFLNDDKNLYILEGKDHQLIEQIIQLKNKDPQQARDLACKLRKRTFISSDIKKNVWKF